MPAGVLALSSDLTQSVTLRVHFPRFFLGSPSIIPHTAETSPLACAHRDAQPTMAGQTHARAVRRDAATPGLKAAVADRGPSAHLLQGRREVPERSGRAASNSLVSLSMVTRVCWPKKEKETGESLHPTQDGKSLDAHNIRRGLSREVDMSVQHQKHFCRHHRSPESQLE